VDTLAGICKKENFTVTEDALYAIAKAAQGSFRDALSILDQISALSDRTISDGDVYSMLGLVETELLFDLTDALAAGDCARALDIFDVIIEKGKDVKQLSRDLVEHFRDLMIIKVGGKTLERLVDYPAAVKELYWNQSQNYTIPGILKALDALIEAQDIARVTETLRTPLEIAFAKLTYRPDGVNTCDFSAPTPAPKAAAPAAVAVLKTPPLPTAQKFSPPEILKDRRGEINLSPDKAVAAAEEEKTERPSAGLLDFEKIRQSWDALTYAVSREKMSLATYLQEGRPVALKGERLTVGFTADLHFHKETLERNEYILLVEKVFSEKLKAKILIEYKIVGENAPAAITAENHEPLVQTALETFKGKIVSKWHNE
jgi:DNA polymerase-3 subunit gamma/tau